jgi:predicted nucleic acid-binding protein
VAELLLDTTVLIDALRGKAAAGRLRELAAVGAAPPFVCAVTVEELWRGARPNEEDAIRRLVGALRLAPLGKAEGERAGRWRRDFAASGTTLSQADCLIAAATLGVGATLATGNVRDYPMPELDVEHWPVDA